FPMGIADGSGLGAVERLARAATLDVAGLPAGRAVIVAARPDSTVVGTGRWVVVAELITGGVLILLLAVGGRWLIGRGLAPLAQMASAARQITTQGDLAAR